MLEGADNSRFGTIKTDLENKTTRGSDSYPRTKDETVGLINNYHMSKHTMRTLPVKEEVEFVQTNGEAKINKNTKKTKKKRESN